MTRALATDPKVLLLDEIAGGLTEREVQDLIETILGLNRHGMTTVWIEHIMHALQAVVDRLICMNLGTKIVDGAPETVINDKAVLQIYSGLDVA